MTELNMSTEQLHITKRSQRHKTIISKQFAHINQKLKQIEKEKQTEPEFKQVLLSDTFNVK